MKRFDHFVNCFFDYLPGILYAVVMATLVATVMAWVLAFAMPAPLAITAAVLLNGYWLITGLAERLRDLP